MAKKNYDYVIKPPNYFLYLAIISIILFVFLVVIILFSNPKYYYECSNCGSQFNNSFELLKRK